MQNCFVTGGTGFVGQYLVAELLARNCKVHCLVRNLRSPQAEKLVALGVVLFQGDLDHAQVLKNGIEGCDTVFHLAASVDFAAPLAATHHQIVLGTQKVLSVAKALGVRRFVYLSAASVAANPRHLTQIPETYTSPKLHDAYSISKAEAELLVLAANTPAFEAVILRPPLIWGVGFSGYAEFKRQAESGQFRFIDGGKHMFSTCHVRNLVQGLVLVATAGPGKEIYFITDGESWGLKRFITTLLKIYHLPYNFGSIPYGLASVMASLLGTLWRVLSLKGQPPLTRTILYLFGKEYTVSDQKIRLLGHINSISIEDGFAELRLSQQDSQTHFLFSK